MLQPGTYPPPVSSLVWPKLRRLVLLSLAMGFLLSLISYHQGDPSWNTWASKTSFHNWMGRMGSILSDLLYQTMGLSSFGWLILLVYFAFQKNSTLGVKRFLGGSFIFLVSLSLVFQTAMQSVRLPFHLSYAGGVLGVAGVHALEFLSGKVGAWVLSISLLLCSVMITFEVDLFGGFFWSLKALLTFIAKVPKRIFQGAAFVVNRCVEKIKARRIRKSLRGHEVVSPQVSPQEKRETQTSKEESPPISQGKKLILAALTALKSHKAVQSKTKSARSTKVKHFDFMKQASTTFTLPSLNLLSDTTDTRNKDFDKHWYLEKGEILVQKLKDFGVEGEIVHISPGPVITIYEFKPASGVKIKEIANLSDDLTLALSVLSVRIVAPIPGKPVVGIEIPSPHRQIVQFKEILKETSFFKSDLRIPIVLGRSASGDPVIHDLASMPHLLIAGSTGTGKSVFINTLISSLLFRFPPQGLKLILVDPKMVELSHYDGIAHLLLPVVVDSRKAAAALRWTVDEMERRYLKMHQFGVRHIDAYNQRLNEMHKDGEVTDHEFLPYIVVVIDEYADLMAVVPKEVEIYITRLSQKARASGIHLVLATQRPSTDVVTGIIKANFPTRISFRVASSIDSKTILDRTGAERLLGHGDLLLHSAGFTTLKRMQGPYVADSDIEDLVEFLKSQGAPQYQEELMVCLDEVSENALDEPGVNEGNLYDAAVRLVSEKGEASISLIQRHLRIGYNRAASLMEQMEKQGVVGQSVGPSKRREVLVSNH